MRVHYSIQRYGCTEFRTVDIDLEEVVKREMQDTIETIGGFESDALETIEIEWPETLRELI